MDEATVGNNCAAIVTGSTVTPLPHITTGTGKLSALIQMERDGRIDLSSTRFVGRSSSH